MEFRHYSVLLHEAVDGLAVKPEGIYCDGTTGGGGHSLEIAKRLTTGHLYCLDQDGDAIAAAEERLRDYQDRVTFIRTNYENMTDVLREQGVTGLDGILLDLGVSSYQIDNSARGFSYMDDDAPLDMRMDQRNPKTAADIVNQYPEEELFRIIRDYGEDHFARQIAREIVREREEAPLRTAGDLNRAIRRAVPPKARYSGGHPSKRTFQALRIELNRELTVLEDSLDGMIGFLNEGGRIAVITFQSLEDRIVKNNFRRNENPCICPPEFPVCVCGRKSKGHVLTKKPIIPSEQEIEENSRSKSAHLRIFEKHTQEE